MKQPNKNNYRHHIVIRFSAFIDTEKNEKIHRWRNIGINITHKRLSISKPAGCSSSSGMSNYFRKKTVQK